MPESKRCLECGAPFTRPAHRSNQQWAQMRCCSTRCANTIRARGRSKQPGDLDLSNGKRAYQTAWQHRQAMPRWATWWENRRRTEDLAELATPNVVYGRGSQLVRRRPRSRQFIAGACPDCGTTVIVIRGWWHDSIRCTGCTKRYWQGNHEERARRNGVHYEYVPVAAVFARDKYRCQICGQKTKGRWPLPTSPTIDHIIPISRGGPHVLHNLQTACLRCNVKKYNGAANDQLRLAV